ncbi:MAG: DUF4332 domain-containing protein [Chloroflexota bacterium]|nr:DUF4332 domain-containing protein [Chloroflexota bacterium]
MLKIAWFVLGLLIGSWLARPASPTIPRNVGTPNGTSDTGSADRFREAAAGRTPERAPAEDAGAKSPATPINVSTLTAGSAQADALIDIKGIGPVFVERLHAAGITTFAQLAAQEPEALAEKLGGIATADRIRRERWIEQAQERSEK